MFRKFAAWILILVLLTAALPAQAADSTAAVTDYLTPGTFSIDGSYEEEGMNASYSRGYEPSVEDGTLHVVLPLLASHSVEDDVIYCDLDLGAADSSPFAYKNYDSIPVHPAESDGQEAPDLYVASFALPLSAQRRNGVYPLGVTIRYRVRGAEFSQFFLIDFTITDGATDVPASSEPEEPYVPDEPDSPGGSDWEGSSGGSDWSGGTVDIPSAGGVDVSGSDGTDAAASQGQASSEPKVILEQAVAAPSPCEAGNSFTVTCTLRNTSKKTAVRNMTVTYKSQTTNLIPDGVSTSYIESIAANSTAQFAFSMLAVEAAESGPQKIDIALAYEGPEGTAYTAADEITVLIQQKIRLEHDAPTFPTTAYIGDSINATLNLYNKGKGTLYNVTVVLDVPGITPESSSFLGNMESGSSKSADIYAMVTGLEDPFGAPEAADDETESAGAGAADDSAPKSAEEIIMEAAEAAPMAAVAAVDTDHAPAVYGADSEDVQGGGGETEGNFIVTYEDEFGNSYEELVPVRTDIEQIIMNDPYQGVDDMMEPEPEQQGMPWWGWVLIAGGGGGAAAALAVRARRRKRAAELEEASADEDDLL